MRHKQPAAADAAPAANDATDAADRRRTRRSLMVLGASVVAAGVVATTALFTDTAVVDDNTFSTGELAISTTPTEAALTAGGMAPGDEVTAPITVSNDGTMELRYAVTSTTDEDVLAAELAMTIKEGVTTCTTTEFGTDGSVIYGPDILGSTTGTDVIGDPAQGEQMGDRVLASGNSEELCFNVLLPAGAGGVEGLTTTATFTFEAEQTTNNP